MKLDPTTCLRAEESEPLIRTAVAAGYEGFEDLGGGCGHDASIPAILGVLIAYEKIRTPEMAEKLTSLTL